MSEPTPDGSGAGHGRKLTIVAVTVVVLAALIGPIVLLARGDRSSAAFGDSQALGKNHLGAATLDIEVGEQSATLSASLMAPGDTAVGWLDLTNRGDLPLRYAIVADNGDDLLMDWLRWAAWTTDTSCDTEPDPGNRLVDDVTLARGTSAPFVGNALVGLDPGDQVLDPGDGERVCIAATLPGIAPDAIQGRTVTQDLRVVAEHHLDQSDQ